MTKLRELRLLLAAALLLAPLPAAAEGILNVAGYGGSFQQAMTASLLPLFQAQCNCRVNYTPGLTSATIARLIAERDHPSLDVAIVDDGPQNRVVQLGLLDKLDTAKVPALAQMQDIARMQDDIGVRLGVSAIGISYDTAAFAAHGWAPPTSWADMGRPEFKGQIAFPSIGNALGVAWLVMAARTHGGSESAIDPGFDAIKPIRDNAVLFDKTADLTPYYQQGTIVMGLMTNFRTALVAAQGLKVAFVYPREGAPASVPTLNLVKGAANADLAAQFINFMISPPAQLILAKSVYFGPLNRTVQLPDDVKRMVVAPEDLEHLVLLDWPVINAHIAAWTERWNREIE